VCWICVHLVCVGVCCVWDGHSHRLSRRVRVCACVRACVCACVCVCMCVSYVVYSTNRSGPPRQPLILSITAPLRSSSLLAHTRSSSPSTNPQPHKPSRSSHTRSVKEERVIDTGEREGEERERKRDSGGVSDVLYEEMSASLKALDRIAQFDIDILRCVCPCVRVCVRASA